jgi:hypothetical protein
MPLLRLHTFPGYLLVFTSPLGSAKGFSRGLEPIPKAEVPHDLFYGLCSSKKLVLDCVEGSSL